MKALTICQPYVELILRGEKRVENRTWSAMMGGQPFRGPMLLHAGKSRDWLTLNERGTVDRGAGIAVADMQFGAIVGACHVVDCVYRHPRTGFKSAWRARYPWLQQHGHASGPYCWILENVVRLKTPLEWSGSQGLWEFKGDVPAELNEWLAGRPAA